MTTNRRGQLPKLKDRRTQSRDDQRTARTHMRKTALEQVAGWTALTMKAHNGFVGRGIVGRLKWLLTGK